MRNTLLLSIFLLLMQFIYSQEKFEETSIIDVIANKEKYNEKKLKIKGYLVLEFENTALYLSKEDYNYKIRKNAIYVYVGQKFLKNQEFPENWEGEGYVEIQGIYSIVFNGHWGMYSGSLIEIQDIDFITPINPNKPNF